MNLQSGRFTSAQQLALAARREIIAMTSAANASHVGSALSVVDILSVLYTGAAEITPETTGEVNRDVVILSKGHAASALYSVLALQGFIPVDWLKKYCENNSPLGGHISHKGIPGVELSTGSLGHGLPYGVGIAIARKLTNISGRIFVVLSDGECDEGTTWESAMVANHHNLDNLTVIIDRNRIQSLTFTEETLKLEPFAEKWRAFGWKTIVKNGHDHHAISEALTETNSPTCIIAETTKGKGVDFMENSVLWHYKSPTEEDLKNAFLQLKTSN